MPEQVLSWNPEVILTMDRTFFESVQRDPLWAGYLDHKIIVTVEYDPADLSMAWVIDEARGLRITVAAR